MRGNTPIEILGHSRHVLDDLALLQHLPFLQEVNLLRGRLLQRERRRRDGTRRLRRRESRRRGRPRPAPTGVSVGGTGTSGVTARIPPSSPKSILATGGADDGSGSNGCELPDTAGAHRPEPESSGSVSGSSPLKYCPGASPPNIPSASGSALTGAGGGGVMLSAAGIEGSVTAAVRCGRFVEAIWMKRVSRLMP
ncbi:hypothetical protein QEG98_15640 [Myxococcus sp. MxC21-1]|uniref:hypothetical protein n=1 Tax=Myxococcus sp. MxC21-1 TaxID=3041439 RepID=UPI00293194C9|nr:hypothetical protein [Myxococcus sp. MxC21-1]WNZ64945.1 hypothetical protein QEG98_15640 [Myxococcus sp. MxC21-1]